VLRPQIFTRARESPSLTSAPPTGVGGPLTTFCKGGSKIGSKCNKLAFVTSELGGVARRNGVDESDPFGVEQKKFYEILSTTNKVISANVDLP